MVARMSVLPSRTVAEEHLEVERRSFRFLLAYARALLVAPGDMAREHDSFAYLGEVEETLREVLPVDGAEGALAQLRAEAWGYAKVLAAGEQPAARKGRW